MSGGNILLITDNLDIKTSVLSKLVLLRQEDKIVTVAFKDYKSGLKNYNPKVVILDSVEQQQQVVLKNISAINSLCPSCAVILLVNDLDSEFILKSYDSGIYDYFSVNDEGWSILIKIVNCLKAVSTQRIIDRNNKFLYSLGILDTKNGLYKHKSIKDMFTDLIDDKSFKNSVFAILTLDDSIKTKVSTNRLAIAIKNSVRQEDIVSIARGGKFYLFLCGIDLICAKSVISKIQEKMGGDFPIHAGVTKIGIQLFEDLEKDALDSLESAKLNNELCVSLTDNLYSGEKWLDDNNNFKSEKRFKIFENAYMKKLKHVIEPIFMRFQRECELKLPSKTLVNQYSNKIESVFSLKNEYVHSELIISFNGYAKLKLDISHSGLDSPENTHFEIPVSKLTDKKLLKFLKTLKDEFNSVNKVTAV